ncbi:MAG: malto-oligosyltrehalose synthase [Desulfurivibrionaceae bacterium]
MERRAMPDTAYRLQFNKDFTFVEAAGLVSYLHDLGVSHLYSSPFLKARPGSSHGYDIVDHNRFNPEIGDDNSFANLVSRLHDKGMGLILDFVPNHMGVGGCDNIWWLDVLEHGRASIYASYFDIDWQPAKQELRNKVLLPVLGDHYGLILDRGELQLSFDRERGDFTIDYYEHCFPVDPATYLRIIRHRLPAADEGEIPEALNTLADSFGALPPRTVSTPEERRRRRDSSHELKKELSALCRDQPEVETLIGRKLAAINSNAADPGGEGALHELLDNQAYRLAYWRVASDEINYRRFFNVNTLAGLRVEEPEVFDDVHRLVFDLIRKGWVDGLRIDHPDGLYDPLAYLERLQRMIGAGPVPGSAGEQEKRKGQEPFYVVVEKILAPFENLPDNWPVAGTTGYDYLNQLNGLFVHGAAKKKMSTTYSSFVGRRLDFDELLYRAKKLIITKQLSSELTVLANQVNRISEIDPHTRDFTLNGLRAALIELVACFPVYRTYVDGGVSQADKQYVDWAVSQAKKWNPEAEVSIFDFLREVIIGAEEGSGPPHHAALKRSFAKKLQQYTSPAMAKSMEDTAFYRYNRLVSLNEVGGDPRNFGIPLAGFHHLNRQRLQHWPRAMLSTSTHDTKRSEDVRARINVLTELAEEWRTRVLHWASLNRRWKSRVDGRQAPARNDEYLLYQNLVGAWPLKPPGEGEFTVFGERMAAYFEKAIRESKGRSSWLNPNEEYERAAARFLEKIIDPVTGHDFLDNFLPFQERIAYFGLFNSLSQVVLKLTSPGVPDIYQGNELWNFSLVDPDNRRPVDFTRRSRILADFEREFSGDAGLAAKTDQLLENPYDGRIKLYVTWQCLQFRQRFGDLFRTGAYLPLAFEGTFSEHLCGFARVLDDSLVLVVVPRFCALLTVGGKRPPVAEVWEDTLLDLASLPRERPFTNVFTGEILEPERLLPVRDILSRFPVALLHQSLR